MTSTAPIGVAEPPIKARSRLAGVIQRRPLASFFVLAYGISWLIWTPVVVAGDDSPTGLGFVLTLLDAAANLPLTIFLEHDVERPFLIWLALMLVAAAVVVAATGPATLSRRPKQTAVP